MKCTFSTGADTDDDDDDELFLVADAAAAADSVVVNLDDDDLWCLAKFVSELMDLVVNFSVNADRSDTNSARGIFRRWLLLIGSLEALIRLILFLM